MQHGIKLLVAWMGVAFALQAQAVDKQMVSGHLPAVMAKVQPLDRLPATNQLDLAIGLPLRNRAELAGLLTSIYDPQSPQFRRYLTPGQFTERFGPTSQDYQAAIRFAQQNGLTVTATHPNRMLVNLRGSVASIESALHVKLQRYPHPTEGRLFYAPDREPSLVLSVPVLHISGLNNYTLPRPRLSPGGASSASPRVGSGPGGTFIGNDFRNAYVPGTSLTGAGQAVGLFELDGYYASDITEYLTMAGLASVPLQNVLIDGFNGIPTGRRPGSGNEEVALDIEMTIAMAPGLAKVLVYEGPPTSSTASINHVLNRMATDNSAKQLSCSWGFDIDITTEQIFLQFAAQGQSFYLASGDNGAFVGPVFQPSDNPYITVVGGTSLTTDASGSWSSEITWNNSGGGISTIYSIPDWQQGIDMSANQGSTTMRNLPDVAMVAENVLAVSDRGRSNPFSGTSIASPLWAAFTALINEQAAATGQAPVGFINPALYTIGKDSRRTDCFHDITVGNNATSSSGNLYPAVPGFDLCTGWGTPTGTNLINALLSLRPQSLLITSPLGFTAHGPIGGPFSVTALTYTLTNTGTAPINWQVVSTSAWLTVSPAGGTLPAGGAADKVTVSLNAAASNLLLGESSASVAFENLSNGTTQFRDFRLLVGNGGFETGDLTNWQLSGDTGANFADSVDASILNGGPTLPGVDDSQFVHTGTYGAFLGQTNSLGTLSQTIPTVPGQSYALSFWVVNPAQGTPNEFRASWNGTALFDQTDLDQFAWTNMQYVVTATATTTVLEFAFQNDQNAFGLDDISIQPVPSSRFESVSLTAGAISLTWSGLSGQAYKVQYTADLNSNSWTDLGNPTTISSGSVTLSDPLSAAAQRFYRIVQVP